MSENSQDGATPLLPRDDGNLHIEDLTLDQFTAVLTKITKGVNPCAICKTDEWNIHLDDDGKPIVAVMLVGGANPNSTLFISCRNCGFIRSFMGGAILKHASQLP